MSHCTFWWLLIYGELKLVKQHLSLCQSLSEVHEFIWPTSKPGPSGSPASCPRQSGKSSKSRTSAAVFPSVVAARQIYGQFTWKSPSTKTHIQGANWWLPRCPLNTPVSGLQTPPLGVSSSDFLQPNSNGLQPTRIPTKAY